MSRGWLNDRRWSLILIIGVLITIAAEAVLILLLRSLIKACGRNRLRIIVASILAVYLVGVFVVTIGIRGTEDGSMINLIPFYGLFKMVKQVIYSSYAWHGWRFYREFKYMSLSLRNLFGNVLLLVPLGCLVPLLMKRFDRWRNTVFLGVAVSLLIEVTQLITCRGCFDIDDVILNSAGCWIGWLCCQRWLKETAI